MERIILSSQPCAWGNTQGWYISASRRPATPFTAVRTGRDWSIKKDEQENRLLQCDSLSGFQVRKEKIHKQVYGKKTSSTEKLKAKERSY